MIEVVAVWFMMQVEHRSYSLSTHLTEAVCKEAIVEYIHQPNRQWAFDKLVCIPGYRSIKIEPAIQPEEKVDTRSTLMRWTNSLTGTCFGDDKFCGRK